MTDLKTVFLVEDDSSAMNLYCNRLEQAGFRTVAAMEAQEAFEALTQASADLIILDLLLPKPGGIELLKAIRSHSRHRETAVLVLSNAYLPEMAQEALKVGANKALPRSECTPAKLLSVVCELVGIAEARGNDPPGAAEGLDANDLAGQLESDLMEQGRAEVAAIQQHYSRFVEHAGSDAAAEHLGQVYQSVRLLTTRAGLAGCGRIGQLTAAIEAVLFECVFRSNGAMSASSMRVLGEAVDCLGGLFTSGDTGSAEYSPFPDGAETMLRGSDDLAAEPFSPLELAVKDTVLLLRTSPIQVPSESQGQMAAPSKPMGGLGKQHTIQLAVEEKLKYLRQALAEETKRREAVDQHAAENAKRRTELETAIEENQRSQQWFQQLLEGSQPQALASEEGGQAGQLNSSGRRRALMAVQNFVADKLIRLKEALTEETKRRETVEQEIAENANRRTELEAALAENQRVQGILQREADTVANHQPLIELESALTASEQSRKNLEGELAAARRKLAALKGGQATAESELESWAVELHVSQAGLEQKVQMLAEALRVEASRRESAEQQVREMAHRESDLEIELAQSRQALAQVSHQIEESQNQLQALGEGSGDERSQVETRVLALQANGAAAEQRMKALAEVLAIETERRKQAEQQASQFAQRQSELEAELDGHKQTQTRVRQQLENARQQRQAHEEGAATEQSELEAGTRELQVAHAKLEREVSRLKQALAAETERRDAVIRQAAEHAQCRGELEAALAENEQTKITLQRELEASESAKRRGELEAELAENKQMQAQLRHDLVEAEQQQQSQQESARAEQTKLEARTRELQLSKLIVEQQVKELSDTLAAETRHREQAQQQVDEIGQQRLELEGQLGQLRNEVEASRGQLQAQQQRAADEEARLQARTEELRSAQAELEQQVKRLTEAFAEESQRRQGAEQQAGEMSQRRLELEAQLGRLGQQLEETQTHLHVETQLRQEWQQAQRHLSNVLRLAESQHAQAQSLERLEEARQQQQAQKEHYFAEQAKLNERTQELQTVLATVEQKVEQLTHELAKETKRREGAERQAGELDKRRSELEAELATNRQAQEQLQQQLAEVQRQLQAVGEQYHGEQSKLDAQLKELQAAQTLLQQKTASLTEAPADEPWRPPGTEQRGGEVAQPPRRAAGRRILSTVLRFLQDRFRRLFKVKPQDGSEHEAVEKAQHQKERAQPEDSGTQQTEFAGLSQELQSAHLDLSRRVMRLTETLTKETRRREGALQQVRELEKRRSELEAQLGHLRQELAASQKQLQAQQEKSRAEQTALEERIKRSESAQAELEQQVKHLATQHDAASRRIHELDDHSQAAARTIRTRDQELAALRHAVLDAARINSNISHERLQVEGQMVEGWKRLITTLLETPLSAAQRGLVLEIVRALEGWTKGRADALNRVESPVEPLDIHRSEFNCTEVIECALAMVRDNADQAGARVQATLIAPVPERAHGSPPHLQQLITLLAASLREVCGAENLEVQVSFKTMPSGAPEMLLSLLLPSSGNEESLRLRLTALAETPATLRTIRCGSPELALASAWQLALALGGNPSIETTADHMVHVEISLPLPAPSSLL